MRTNLILQRGKSFSRLNDLASTRLDNAGHQKKFSRLNGLAPTRPDSLQTAKKFSRLNEISHPKPRPERGFPHLDVQL